LGKEDPGGVLFPGFFRLVHRFVNNYTNPQASEWCSYFENDVLV